MNRKEELKDILFELFCEFNNYEDIIYALRNKHSDYIITDEEYNSILENYDKWLKEWEEDTNTLENIIDDLLQDYYNDLYEYENIEKEQADIIYKNVKLFALKLKDRLGVEFYDKNI